jgi:putative hydrolase of the HAD superfamily
LQYSAIVFDLFHTIVDPEDFRPKDHRRAEQVVKLLRVDAAKFSSYWSKTLSTRNTSRSVTPIHLVEQFLAKEGLTRDREVLAKIDYELGRFQDMALLNPRPDVVSALRSLRDQGLKLGLLSNCDSREARQWPNSPIAPLFHSACFSYDIGVVKPDARAYETVLERLGEIGKRSVYVGDGGSNELQGAKAAGIKLTVFMEGFVASNGLRTPDEIQRFRRVADVSIHRLEELIPRLI